MSSAKSSGENESRPGKRGKHKKPKEIAAGLAVIGECVREGRREQNMSQRILAEKIGVGKRTIMDIEADIGNPKFEVLYGLVREFKMPVYRIFYPDVPEEFDERKKLFEELDTCTEKELEVILPMVKNLKEILRLQRKKRTRKGPGVKNAVMNAESGEEEKKPEEEFR